MLKLFFKIFNNKTFHICQSVEFHFTTESPHTHIDEGT